MDILNLYAIILQLIAIPKIVYAQTIFMFISKSYHVYSYGI